MATISVEYCYAYRYQELAGYLRQIPGVKVNGVTGRPDSFEVMLEDQLLYSKLETGEFPDAEQMSKKVKELVPKENCKNSKFGKKKCSLQ